MKEKEFRQGTPFDPQPIDQRPEQTHFQVILRAKDGRMIQHGEATLDRPSAVHSAQEALLESDIAVEAFVCTVHAAFRKDIKILTVF